MLNHVHVLLVKPLPHQLVLLFGQSLYSGSISIRRLVTGHVGLGADGGELSNHIVLRSQVNLARHIGASEHQFQDVVSLSLRVGKGEPLLNPSVPE